MESFCLIKTSDGETLILPRHYHKDLDLLSAEGPYFIDSAYGGRIIFKGSYKACKRRERKQ